MLLKPYRPADLFDELIDSNGQVRPYYQPVVDRLFHLDPADLAHKVKNLELLFLKHGVTFTVYVTNGVRSVYFPLIQCLA